MFGHGINLNHLGVICIPIKIEMCLVMGVIPCTSKNIHCSTLHGRCLVISVK